MAAYSRQERRHVVGSFFRMVRQTIWPDGTRNFFTRECGTSFARQGAGHLCLREGPLALERSTVAIDARETTVR